jgi:hypothetical protein
MLRTLTALLSVSILLGSQQGTGLDDQILEKGDKLLEEAKAAYEDARSKSSVAAFVDAGFKLEEARIKFIVLQEIGSPEKQKIATDRLRAINQLSKLIHDGKVAISGKAADASATAPNPPAPEAPANPADPPPKPAPAAIDVTKRAPVPDPAKQKDAEKLLKDLFKDQYAKKPPADRQALARALLDQARKSSEDPVALWVVYREAQDVAVQVCDVRTAMAAIDECSRFFDVDSMAMKNAALTACGKTAKAPEDFAALAEALDRLIEDLTSADQYEVAEKAAATALQYARKVNAPRLVSRATLRSKEVAEAKSRYQAMKAVLQTLAKTPDDANANLEMGQFLCFIKGNWDLGLRFLVKSGDAGLKALAEKELALPTAFADQIAIADGWYELGEKEKLPSKKYQLLNHAREFYTLALPQAVALQKAKLEKRLEQIEASVGAAPGEAGTINLFKLIDLKKDVLSGSWSQKGNAYTCAPQGGSRLQVPYNLPAEYDLLVTMERVADDFLVLGLVSEVGTFSAVIDWNFHACFELLDGKDSGAQSGPTTYPNPPVPVGKPVVIKAAIRRTSAKLYIDGKLILNWEGGMKRLTPNGGWIPPNSKCPILGSHKGQLLFTAVTLVPILDPGKPLR